MDTILKVRLMHFRDGLSMRFISRKMGLSRHTVKKYLDDASPPQYRRQIVPAGHKLHDFKDRLQYLFEHDLMLPKRGRRTAIKLYEQLVLEGYKGSYYPVRRHIQSIKHTALGTTAAYIPMQFQSGDAMQFDWSEEHVVIGGVACKIKVAHFRLSHSRKPFVRAYMNEQQEMLMDAFGHAFTFYGGVPRRVIIDNPKTMVTTVLRSKERGYNSRFMSMANHYIIEPVACTPASGWEKGQIERQVRDLRGHLFTPKRSFDDLESLNAYLYKACDDIGSRPHPEQKEKTVDEIFAAEKGDLHPLGEVFDGYVEKTVKVQTTSLVQYDKNRYSVPVKFASSHVSLRAYADRIMMVSGQEVIAEHKREFTRDCYYFKFWHYIDLLAKKPGGLRDGAPFKEPSMPPSLVLIKDHYLKEIGGDREFVDILLLANEYGVKVLTKACDMAVKQGTLRLAAIINSINRLLEPDMPPPIDVDAYPKLKFPPEANCARYEALCAGSGVAS